MKFEVAYRTADGKMAETTIEVADRNAVYSELRRQGITPISLHEAGTKTRGKSAASVQTAGVVKFVFMLALLAFAVFAVWYFVLADEGTKRHVRNLVTPSTKVDIRNHGPDAPRKGTGAVSVKISE
ncbi:MAG: hypothetical protein IKU71_09340 [Kiritimatiellae bacterium]|nr:hypothetical protein [Kiritimatiellia bacterium]